MTPTPEQIRTARKQARLTQAKSAQLVGYNNQSMWANIEAGRCNMAPWRWRLYLHLAGIERLPFGDEHGQQNI